MGTWVQRILGFFVGGQIPVQSPTAGTLPATYQHAEVDGRNNIIVQIQGNGNPVVPYLAHLTLTRYLTRRSQITSEADLLSSYAMTIPMVGRETQMAELHRWMTNGKPLSICILTGRAGSGKTRLALELCETALAERWDAGFVTDRELDRFMDQQNLSTWGWQHPTLIIIDYAAAHARKIHDWFVELADNGGVAQKPLRILLLERHADPSGGWWELAFGRGGGDARAVWHLLDPPYPIPLPSLSGPEDRRKIVASVLERAGSAVRPPELGANPIFDRQLAELSWGGEPLFLMMAGLTAAKLGFGRVLALTRTDLAREIADREINRIEKIAKERGIKDGFLSHMAAYVTLCQGLDRAVLEEAIEEEKEALRRHAAGDPYDIANALYTVLPGENGAVSPVLPDMIGEAVILHAFEQLCQEGQIEAVARAFRRARLRVAATVIRAAQDYSLEDHLAPLGWLDRLAREGVVDLTVLIEIADQLPHSTLVLRERAAAIRASIVEAAWQLVSSEDNERTRTLLAVSLNNLANCLSDLGRREEALTAAQEAVEIRRQLAATYPDAFPPDLAGSLNNLANCLSDLGRREEALTAAQEAAEIRHQLAATYPDAFRPALARSLNTLATCLSSLGHREEALTVAQGAVEIRRQLAAIYPDAFRPNFSGSLNNLANCLSALGWREEALTTVQEAVEIRRQLAATRPDAFRPDLAGSLNNLASCLSALGRREEALTAAQEAVEIRRQLAATHPDAFRPDLAGSLSNLANRLSNLGHREEALTAAQEAVEIYRQLAATRPDAFCPNLAVSLNNLADCLSDVGHRKEALTTAREAIAILSPYFRAHPAASAQWMATMVRNYLDLVETLHRKPDPALLPPIIKEMNNNGPE